MTIACILCSTGGVIAAISFCALGLGPDSGKFAGAMLALAFLGAASCAAEDRVCELAGMPTAAP
jgi:hypothetical protein